MEAILKQVREASTVFRPVGPARLAPALAVFFVTL